MYKKSRFFTKKSKNVISSDLIEKIVKNVKLHLYSIKKLE